MTRNYALMAAVIAVVLSGCGTTTQLSSGQAYLKKYERNVGNVARPPLSEEIRQAAAVEPALRFPARIGLARVDNGRLSGIPRLEADAWMEMAERLGPEFGTFVPVSPLIAKLAAGEIVGEPGNAYSVSIEQTIREIRLGAARQHVDVVLIYEVFGKADDEATPLAVADLTIVGAYIVPSRALSAKGMATALLVDVRNGYPYGTAEAVADDWTLAPSVGSTAKTYALADDAKTVAAVKLTTEVETMARQLRKEIAARAGNP